MILKKITFNHVDGIIWLDKETFEVLVNFYLASHHKEATKIEIAGFEHDGAEGNT